MFGKIICASLLYVRDLSPHVIASLDPPYGAAVQPHGGAVLTLINHDRAPLT